MKKRRAAAIPPPAVVRDTNTVQLPHLVYKVEFHENESTNNIWAANDPEDVLKNIMQESTDGNKKKESKVIVVLELPVGGSVARYNVGDTDDTLEVVIAKHSLMLNPKALLFSGITAGVLNNNTDGPNTARGGIRLNECSKALAEYRKLSETKNKKDGLSHNEMLLKFNLPDFVSRENILHYSYCFQQTEYNQLQYNITYFEFETKASKVDIKDDPFTKATSMFFSDGNNNNGGNDQGDDNANDQQDEDGEQNDQGAATGGTNLYQQDSSTSFYSGSGASRKCNNGNFDNLDEEMFDDDDTFQVTKGEITGMKQKVSEEVSKQYQGQMKNLTIAYDSRLKRSETEAKNQRKKIKKLKGEIQRESSKQKTI